VLGVDCDVDASALVSPDDDDDVTPLDVSTDNRMSNNIQSDCQQEQHQQHVLRPSTSLPSATWFMPLA